jgi:hypothetical protein
MSSKKGPDPGSGKNSFRIRIPDPGGKKAPDPGSGSATLGRTDEVVKNYSVCAFLKNLYNLRGKSHDFGKT